MEETLGRRVWRQFVRVNSVLNAVASFWYFLIMLLVVADVVGRIFGTPVTGTPELVKISIVGMFFLHLPHAVWQRRLIRSEFIYNRLKPRTKVRVQILYDLLGMIFLILIFISTWEDALEAWRIFDYEGEGALRVPTYPVYTLILVGSAFGTVLFLARAVVGVHDLKFKKDGGE